MLITYPVLSDAGLDSIISGHFGKSPYFAVIDPDTRDCKIHDVTLLRDKEECAPLRALARMGVKEVYCVHMGRNALARCFRSGLQVYQTASETLAEALIERAAGLCRDLPDDALCESHEHHHHH